PRLPETRSAPGRARWRAEVMTGCRVYPARGSQPGAQLRLARSISRRVRRHCGLGTTETCSAAVPRRTKTQALLPSEDAVLLVLFGGCAAGRSRSGAVTPAPLRCLARLASVYVIHSLPWAAHKRGDGNATNAAGRSQ